MNTPPPLKIFDATVRQDKTPQVRYTTDSTQPDTADAPPVDRKSHGSEKRKTVSASARLRPHIKQGMLAVAKASGWSESKAIDTACEAYLENDLGQKFGVRLATLVTEAIDSGLQKYSNREANLSFKAYYSAEQTRILTIQTLNFLLVLIGDGLAELPAIISDSQEKALENMKHHVREEGNKH